MPSNNSPAKVMSRLMHSDYFDNEWLKHQFSDQIEAHLIRCQHPKCKQIKMNRDDLTQALLIGTTGMRLWNMIKLS